MPVFLTFSHSMSETGGMAEKRFIQFVQERPDAMPMSQILKQYPGIMYFLDEVGGYLLSQYGYRVVTQEHSEYPVPRVASDDKGHLTHRGEIGYEFELEREVRYLVDVKNPQAYAWLNHVFDTYDKSGRVRVRV